MFVIYGVVLLGIDAMFVVQIDEHRIADGALFRSVRKASPVHQSCQRFCQSLSEALAPLMAVSQWQMRGISRC